MVVRSQLENVKRCLEVIRKFKDTPDCPITLKGALGNLLGELREVEKYLECPPISGTIQNLIREYDNDPVIRAYLDQREDWKDKIHTLKSEISNVFTNYFDD